MALTLKSRPQWLSECDRFSVFLTEPPFLLKFRGGRSVDAEAEYERALSDETLDALFESGARLVWLHAFLGFGLEFESSVLDGVSDFVERARVRGIRVAARIAAGSLTPETLLLEVPEAQNWFQVNQDGHTTTFPAPFESFRVRPCYNSEGYTRYMLRVCSRVVETGADLIHFEGIGYNPEPDTCHCPVCVAAFREMLRDAYGPQEESTREAGMDRFGHNTFTHVRPPTYARWDQALQQPRLNGVHQQEWVRFKVRSVSSYLERLASHVTGKNPECAVGMEARVETGANSDWLRGLNYAELLPRLDYLSVGTAGVQSSHLSRARACKMADSFGAAVRMDHDQRARPWLEIGLAEDLAFNPNGSSAVSGALQGCRSLGAGAGEDGVGHCNLVGAYMTFHKESRDELFKGARVVPGVAILRDTSSLANNSLETHLSVSNVEKTLLENGVPFGLAFSNQLEELSRYRAVVLANVECLSDGDAAAIRAYVEAGGGVVVTENTGRCDEWYRERSRPILADLFGPAFPNAIRSRYGAGRAVYVPCLEHVTVPATPSNGCYVTEAICAQPRNAALLLDAVQYAAGGLPVEISVESGRIEAELAALPDGAAVVHVINTDANRLLKGLRVALRVERAPEKIRAFSPSWRTQYVPFKHDEQAGRVCFEYEGPARYIAFRVE